MKRVHALGIVAMLASTALVASCSSSSSTQAGAANGPKIDQPGKTMSRLSGPLVDVVVDYKFASLNQGDEWMILNVAITTSSSQAIEVNRADVSVKTPDGRSIPLPPYAEFNAAYPEIQSAARRATLSSDPIDFASGGRETCDLRFQPLPGTVASLETVYVNKRKICQALLFFPVQGGVQPGKWEFIIEFEEFEAKVPFEIEAPN